FTFSTALNSRAVFEVSISFRSCSNQGRRNNSFSSTPSRPSHKRDAQPATCTRKPQQKPTRAKFAARMSTRLKRDIRLNSREHFTERLLRNCAWNVHYLRGYRRQREVDSVAFTGKFPAGQRL